MSLGSSSQFRPGQLLGILVLTLAAGGCRDQSQPPGSARQAASTTPGTTGRPPTQAGAEVAVPSTGQAIDASQAVDIVRAEVQGGEADAKVPTPFEFLYQEADPKLISDQPFLLIEPLGLNPTASLVPDSNPMTRGKVELGKQLYYDQRLSLDATVSCASCHDPARGWTDNRATSVGIGNQLGSRNSPTVLNTIFNLTHFWDGRAPSLEGQAQGPIQNKIEMGDQSYRQIIERLRAIPGYRDQFRRVFGTDVTLDALAKAIASFERTALSGNSAYDRYRIGDREDRAEGEPTERTFRQMTLNQKRGMVLFGLATDLKSTDPDADTIDPKLRGRAGCTNCHSGANFADNLYHNLGIGFDASSRKFADLGRWVISPIGAKMDSERGAFKTPTLRDITRTSPYMHDGSKRTLAEVVAFYNDGGNRNPYLDRKISPLNLTQGEQADLVAFLQSLTGQEVVVAVPTLPAGPNGPAPDPRAALNHPGAAPSVTRRDLVDQAHGVVGLR